MPRQQKQYHFIYKTTCLITNKFYVGMHSTNNLDDGYLGSGKRLGYSLNKHGRENHQIERIEFFEIRKDLKNREIELVNEALLHDPLCMNLKIGGEGGFSNEEHRKKCTIAGLKSQWNNPEYIKWHKDRQAKRFSELNKNKPENWGMKNKKHSEKTKEQWRKAHKGKHNHVGENNSMYGIRWIIKNNEVKKIKKEDLNFWLNQGWKPGRKNKGLKGPNKTMDMLYLLYCFG
jgi:hypothetical protein